MKIFNFLFFVYFYLSPSFKYLLSYLHAGPSMDLEVDLNLQIWNLRKNIKTNIVEFEQSLAYIAEHANRKLLKNLVAKKVWGIEFKPVNCS